MPSPANAAADPSNERALPVVTREARVEPAVKGEGEKTNSIRLIWTTGSRVRRYDWWNNRYYDEELSIDAGHIRLDRINSGNAPLLNSHNAYDLDGVLGVIEADSARRVKDQWELEARLDDGPETAAIRRKVANGIIRNVSVGYRVYKYHVTEEEGQIPVYRAVDWEPVEVSLVPVPADPGAHMRGERNAQDANPCQFINHQRKEPTMPKDTELTETPDAKAAKGKATQNRSADPEPSETPTQEPAAPTEAAIRAEGAKAERTRIDEINKRVKLSGLPDDLAKRLISENKTIAQAGDAIFEEKARKQEAEQGHFRSHVSVGETDRDKFLRGASDWLLTKAGVAAIVEKHRNEKVIPGEFRGLTLLDLARQCLENSGVDTRGMDKMTLVGTAFTHRGAITQSTSDFAVLLENTMHKTLLAAYGTTPDTWTRFCAVGSVSDFRPHNRYRMGSFSRLDTVNELGEFKNKAIPDGAKETIQAVTKGNIINLSRQTIINDDMGAFNRLAAQLGRAAKMTIEMDVYDLLALNSGTGPAMNDGQVLFHSSHNNISTGAALTAAAIDLDRVKMASQTDPSGNEYLDLRPAVLLVPLSLGSTARVINESQYDPDTVANKSQMKPNAVRGLFRDVVDSPRLTGTRRYLFADPAIAPTIEVAFLDGQSEPFLESQDGWRVDGTEWKVRLDYGVDAIDFRGAITNAGV